MQQMTASFKNAEINMNMGMSVDDVINRLDSESLQGHIGETTQKKMSQKMNEIHQLSAVNQNMSNAIKEKDQKIEQERMQREKLENMLHEMEAKMMHGGDAIEEHKEKIKAKAFREYQLKLK
jgi:predicted RNase H-like nuclease (RuvC/YqgF family)